MEVVQVIFYKLFMAGELFDNLVYLGACVPFRFSSFYLSNITISFIP